MSADTKSTTCAFRSVTRYVDVTNVTRELENDGLVCPTIGLPARQRRKRLLSWHWGPSSNGLRMRESSRYHEKKESDQAITQHWGKNTNEEDAERPVSDTAVRSLEGMNRVP